MQALLEELKLLLRVTGEEEDELLKSLTIHAMRLVEDECNITLDDIELVSPQLKSIIVDMVLFRYTVLGKEGVTSENIVELSYSYAQDYPQYIMRRLKRHRVMRIV